MVWVFQGNTILVKRAINKKKRNIEFPFLHIALKMKTFSMKTFSIQQWYRKNEIFFLSLFKSCLGQQWQWARSLKQWQGPACNDLGKLSSVWLILKHNYIFMSLVKWNLIIIPIFFINCDVSIFILTLTTQSVLVTHRRSESSDFVSPVKVCYSNLMTHLIMSPSVL